MEPGQDTVGRPLSRKELSEVLGTEPIQKDGRISVDKVPIGQLLELIAQQKQRIGPVEIVRKALEQQGVQLTGMADAQTRDGWLFRDPDGMQNNPNTPDTWINHNLYVVDSANNLVMVRLGANNKWATTEALENLGITIKERLDDGIKSIEAKLALQHLANPEDDIKPDELVSLDQKL